MASSSASHSVLVHNVYLFFFICLRTLCINQHRDWCLSVGIPPCLFVCLFVCICISVYMCISIYACVCGMTNDCKVAPLSWCPLVLLLGVPYSLVTQAGTTAPAHNQLSSNNQHHLRLITCYRRQELFTYQHPSVTTVTTPSRFYSINATSSIIC